MAFKAKNKCGILPKKAKIMGNATTETNKMFRSTFFQLPLSIKTPTLAMPKMTIFMGQMTFW